VIERGELAVLLLPGIGTKDDLKMARDLGAKVAQIATHVTEADVAQQHIELAKSMGMEVIGMLMLSHMGSPEKIAEQGKLMESYGADVVLVTDSAGALLPPTVRERVRALRDAIQIGVGFHGHNNLSMAVANSIIAIEEGARWLDACTCGLGAGSGKHSHRGSRGCARQAWLQHRNRSLEDHGRCRRHRAPHYAEACAHR
jgi:4-hydroxy 2-oxovalerate aldolase